MVNFGPLTAEIDAVVWVTPANFNGFRVLAALLHGISSSGRQPNFAALDRGRRLCSAGRPSRWALAHILVMSIMCSCVGVCVRDFEYFWGANKWTAECAVLNWLPNRNLFSSSRIKSSQLMFCPIEQRQTVPYTYRHTQDDSDVISSYHMNASCFFSAIMRNICYCDITFLVKQW